VTKVEASHPATLTLIIIPLKPFKTKRVAVAGSSQPPTASLPACLPACLPTVHQQFAKYFFAKKFFAVPFLVTFSSSRPAWLISFITITVPTDQQPASAGGATAAADRYEP